MVMASRRESDAEIALGIALVWALAVVCAVVVAWWLW